MAIDPLQSLLALQADLQAGLMREEIRHFGWKIEPEPVTSLTFYVTMASRVDNRKWTLRFECTNYREWPPSIQCVNPETKDPSDASAWPQCQGFRPPVDLCMNISREGLLQLHPDWQRTSFKWTDSGNPIYYVLVSIQTRLDDPSKYTPKAG